MPMSDEDTTAGEGDDFRTPEASDDEDDVGSRGPARAPRDREQRTGTGTVNDRPTSSADAPVEIQLPDELDAALTPEAVRNSNSYFD